MKKFYPFVFFILAISHIIFMFSSPFSYLKYTANTKEASFSTHQEIKKLNSAMLSRLYQSFNLSNQQNYESVNIYSFRLKNNVLYCNFPNEISNNDATNFEVRVFSIYWHNIRFICYGRIFFFCTDILLLILGSLILYYRWHHNKKGASETINDLKRE